MIDFTFLWFRDAFNLWTSVINCWLDYVTCSTTPSCALTRTE